MNFSLLSEFFFTLKTSVSCAVQVLRECVLSAAMETLRNRVAKGSPVVGGEKTHMGRSENGTTFLWKSSIVVPYHALRLC